MKNRTELRSMKASTSNPSAIGRLRRLSITHRTAPFAAALRPLRADLLAKDAIYREHIAVIGRAYKELAQDMAKAEGESERSKQELQDAVDSYEREIRMLADAMEQLQSERDVLARSNRGLTSALARLNALPGAGQVPPSSSKPAAGAPLSPPAALPSGESKRRRTKRPPLVVRQMTARKPG